MLRQLIFYGFIVSIVLLLYTILLYFLQRSFIYFPTAEIPNRQNLHAENIQQIKLHTKDNLLLNSWYKTAEPNKPTILYFHGNAGNIGGRIFLARQFINAGFGVLLLEYRGYGGNEGQPTEQGLYQDGRAAIDFLQQQKITTKQLVLYGESLGTGVATQLATEFSVCAVILQSPYTSLKALARYHYFWLPVIKMRDKFDSLARINKIKAPLLMLHGTKDLVVPYAEGVKLFNYANEPKQWVDLPNKGHNNLWDLNFTNKVKQFINTHCQANFHQD